MFSRLVGATCSPIFSIGKKQLGYCAKETNVWQRCTRRGRGRRTINRISVSLLFLSLLWLPTAAGFVRACSVRALALPRTASRHFHGTRTIMVEGHSVHRVAAAHRERLIGKRFKATSPNGRFAAGAAAIDGQTFQRIEAVGKNLFAFFGSANGPQAVVHVHFGMAGVWSVFDGRVEVVPPTTATTRLCLQHPESGLVSHLSAMTVQLGDESLYHTKKAALGQDPLRQDANPDLLFSKVRKSTKRIGELVMDQSFFCGPGNIYRAEILFKAGVHPNIPGRDITRERFDLIWHHTVALLTRGFECGSILTVDPAEAAALGKPALRRYIYNSATCGRCGTRVQTWDIASRTCYACPSCQPSALTDILSEDATHAKVFVSHCAREPLAERLAQGPDKLLVRELAAELSKLGLATNGRKSQLILRLDTALQKAAALGGRTAGGDRQEGKRGQKNRHQVFKYPALDREDETCGVSSYGTPGMLLNAAEAAAEKASAGEARNVEHIAELHPLQAAAAAGTAGAGRKRKANQVDRKTNQADPNTGTGTLGNNQADIATVKGAAAMLTGIGARQVRPRPSHTKPDKS